MWSACAAIALVAPLAGCGSSGSHAATDSTRGTESASVPPGVAAGLGAGSQHPGPRGPSIGVATGAREKNGQIRARNTCNGGNVSPQLSWKGLPGVLSSTKEIVILVHTISSGKVTTNWAVAGVNPSVNYVEYGQVPKGAVVGRNSYGELGYNVCPPHHEGLITMGIDALPVALHLKQGFDPKVLNKPLESPEVQWGSAVLFGTVKGSTERKP
jgi:phosphatidylethanolamine-binding protein (PEBP) family uncharacterized protein